MGDVLFYGVVLHLLENQRGPATIAAYSCALETVSMRGYVFTPPLVGN
jgi:hypothetical protein